MKKVFNRNYQSVELRRKVILLNQNKIHFLLFLSLVNKYQYIVMKLIKNKLLLKKNVLFHQI